MSAPIPVFSDRPKAAPTPKLRALVKYPGNIVGGTGIDVTKQHGTVTVDMQWNDFGLQSAIPTSPTNNILTFDTATNQYVMIPSSLLGGAVAGIADAPNDGTQYGRQSAGWTPVAVNNFIQAGTGAVTRTMQDKARERVSALDFGADNTGATDTSTALQNWLTYLVSHGGCGRLPAGHYKCGTGLIIDESTNNDLLSLKFVTIVGDGLGNTCIDFTGASTAALTYKGNSALFDSPLTIQGIQFRAGYGQPDTIGLLLNVCANVTVKDCFFYGFVSGVILQDVVSAYLIGNWFVSSYNFGLIARSNILSPPNAISLYSNVFGGAGQFGVWLKDCTSIDIRGGSVEGNGLNLAIGDRCGLLIQNNVSDGAGVAVNVDGVYFEGNGGVADVRFLAGAYPTSMRVVGCNFNRTGPTSPNNVTNNVYVDLSGGLAKTLVTLSGNGHRGFSGYVPNIATPYVAVNSASNTSWNVVDIGNLYESNIEKPVIPGPVNSGAAMASCYVNFNGTNAAINGRFNVGTLVRNSVGVYTITFERLMVSSTYAIVGGFNGVGSVVVVSNSNASVQFATYSSSGTLVDFTYVNIIIFGCGDLT